GSLRKMLRGRRVGYLLGLTVLVVAAGTIGVYISERGQRGAVILSLGDALWWAASLVTTINNELYPVSVEGRVLGILLRIYAVGIFGLLAASFASYLIGQQQEQGQADAAARDALAEEVRRLREEVRALRLQQAAPSATQPPPPRQEA
ncbi:MAG TPA: potassium channel family protein, partial [Thermomicrobiales bacterium]|nr:potassium channel family protein [Thermomicrobiales bacterium]